MREGVHGYGRSPERQPAQAAVDRGAEEGHGAGDRRYRFFNVTARVVHHGRYRILKFARGLNCLMDIREPTTGSGVCDLVK